jgi:predicted anti-sigma-YlaC factor YlaD
MTDCSNIDIREVLPEFLHGTLEHVTRERVQAHLDTCPECSDELRVLRAIRMAAMSPWVDSARIAAAIPPYRRQGRVFASAMQPLRLAAAFLIAAVGISAVAVTHYRGAEQAAVSGSPTAAVSPGIAIVGVSELSDDHLEQLISEMDQIEAAPPTNPEPVVPADVEGGA